MNIRYLELLSREYPSVEAASEQIIRLKAVLSLPKGTEYFFSDLHGEHEAFFRILRSASGIIRTKIDDTFGQSVSEQERTALASLIYAPEKELPKIRAASGDFDDWCRIAIYRLVKVCKAVSSKYTRSQVRKKIPDGYQNIVEELLHTDDVENKSHYYSEIITSIIEIKMAERFIVVLSTLIGQLAIDKLHIIGDIFDRGPHADEIMDELMRLHSVDVQWGNHDISWMGAVTGNWACIANVIRLGISYNNFDLLEDGYGINLRSLSVFASTVYEDDPCEIFTPHILDENKYDPVDIRLAAKMHKAIAIIQFKVEGQLILRHPEYRMNDRILLDKINYADKTVTVNGTVYPLRDSLFPTVNPADPLALTEEESELMTTIAASFRHSENLQRHIKFLYSNGSMYKSVNTNLLYHGCIPMTEDGEFAKVTFDGRAYSGKSYLDYIDEKVRTAYFGASGSAEKHDARDFIWYLWCGTLSPLFGKSKMSTFEKYFIDAPETHKERMNPYYKQVDKRETCEKILREFGLSPENAHIINGHVPVKIKEGESPVKGGGLLYVIDGGISKAYQSQTGIGGYTLIFNSRFLALAAHKPYGENEDGELSPEVRIVEQMKQRVLVAHTDEGKELAEEIEELKALLDAYRSGAVKEKEK